MSAFRKCQLTGPGAEAFLDQLAVNRIPKKTSSIALAYALGPAGGVHSELSIMREGPQSFYLVYAGVYQRLDNDWLKKQMPKDGSMQSRASPMLWACLS